MQIIIPELQSTEVIEEPTKNYIKAPKMEETTIKNSTTHAQISLFTVIAILLAAIIITVLSKILSDRMKKNQKIGKNYQNFRPTSSTNNSNNNRVQFKHFDIESQVPKEISSFNRRVDHINNLSNTKKVDLSFYLSKTDETRQEGLTPLSGSSIWKQASSAATMVSQAITRQSSSGITNITRKDTYSFLPNIPGPFSNMVQSPNLTNQTVLHECFEDKRPDAYVTKFDLVNLLEKELQRVREESMEELAARISFINKGVMSKENIGKCIDNEFEQQNFGCKNMSSQNKFARRKSVRVSHEVNQQIDNDYVEFPFIL